MNDMMQNSGVPVDAGDRRYSEEEDNGDTE